MGMAGCHWVYSDGDSSARLFDNHCERSSFGLDEEGVGINQVLQNAVSLVLSSGSYAQLFQCR
jgi:hypothetical protein